MTTAPTRRGVARGGGGWRRSRRVITHDTRIIELADRIITIEDGVVVRE